jgi:hypothetical protein
MTKHVRDSEEMIVRYKLSRGATAYQPGKYADPMATDAISAIEAHLGGSGVLKQLGAGGIVADKDHVSFALHRPNPKGVHTVVITAEPGGNYHMDFYGERPPGYLAAPHLASASQVVPENLATVLGQLTGVETVHHRHF